jgi:hypothetical protein
VQRPAYAVAASEAPFRCQGPGRRKRHWPTCQETRTTIARSSAVSPASRQAALPGRTSPRASLEIPS